ncbi:MAG TPA: endonuclease III [Patescibacteria group bacterium]|nr:endonuclease III [Patescibacteria group bacterium]
MSFSIDNALKQVKKVVIGKDIPVISQFADDKKTAYELLIATILSLRTKDKTTEKAAKRLFVHEHTPQRMILLSDSTIERLIYPVGFYKRKARTIKQISHILIKKYHGTVPQSFNALLSLPGVGRKTANLVRIEAFKKPGICVDTHVHRISNRWGYVSTKHPEETENVLRSILPRKHWLSYNKLLVAFGQTVCTPVRPYCSICPLTKVCPKHGVSVRR